MRNRFKLILCCAILIGLGMASFAHSYKLPDTGQVKCYDGMGAEIVCPAPGQPLAQDGSYPRNPLSYTDNKNGTITDNNTGLIWQKEDDGGTYNWYVASGTYHATHNPTTKNACGELRTGGYSDWRLPTKRDLTGIVKHGLHSPAADPAFYNTKLYYYWSLTDYESNPDIGWSVHFVDGYTSSHYKTSLFYVRCVRGREPVPFGDFTDNANGTVTEKTSGLLWQKEDGGKMTWVNALNYCESSSLAGFTDWRLPNIKELESLSDFTRFDPAISKIYFPDTKSAFYWSSTTYTYDPDVAWFVGFEDSYVSANNKFFTYYVRCVRGGQAGSVLNVTISKIGTGDGVVTATGCTLTWNGNTGTCTANAGTNIEMKGTPGAGSAFTGWTGGCSGTESCRFRITDHMTITSYFRSKTGGFTDVPIGSWEENYVETMYAKNITTGCGITTYCPSDPVTNEQMAAFIVRAIEGEPPSDSCASGSPFADVPSTSWSCRYIKRVSELGIMTGCGSGNFCPSSLVLRWETAQYMVIAKEGTNIPDYCVNGSSFNDVAPTLPYCRYTERLKHLGITTGCKTGEYCPLDTLNRDAMSAFLTRTFFPGATVETMRFVFLADSRSGSYGNPPIVPVNFINTAVLSPIVAQILALSPRPDFVVFGGDMAYRGHYKDSTNIFYTYQAFKDVIAPLTAVGITIYTTMGNHELYDTHAGEFVLDNQTAFQAAFTDNPNNGPTGYERLVYSFTSHGKDSFFAVLDPYYLTTNIPDTSLDGNIDDKQLSWITGQVAQTNATHKFLFIHTPYYYMSGSHPNTSFTKLWSLLDDNGFDFYACGHSHLYSRKIIDSSVQPNPQLDPSVHWKNNVVQLLNGTCGAELDTDTFALDSSWHIFNALNAPNTYFYSVVDVSGIRTTVNSYGYNTTTGASSVIDSFMIQKNTATGGNVMMPEK